VRSREGAEVIDGRIVLFSCRKSDTDCFQMCVCVCMYVRAPCLYTHVCSCVIMIYFSMLQDLINKFGPSKVG
jgi:hypothetical protein